MGSGLIDSCAMRTQKCAHYWALYTKVTKIYKMPNTSANVKIAVFETVATCVVRGGWCVEQATGNLESQLARLGKAALK